MAFARVRLDRRGIREVLKSDEVAREIAAIAESIASEAGSLITTEGIGEDVVQVTTYTTDRAAAAVDIRHPAGQRIEAKYGVLTTAAASAGLEVKSRG